jgi:hypothetical protein
MSKLNNYKQINSNGKNYVVCNMKYLTSNVPIIIDANIFNKIKNEDKTWRINNNGSVVTTYVNKDGDKKEINMHEVVMYLNGRTELIPILHINKIGIDNRYENLMYDKTNKYIKKNSEKKARTVELPNKCGINPDDLPSYVWYIREDKTHGDRFTINIDSISWKSSSSKTLSLNYKLEETKKFLRHLRRQNPNVFEKYSMNGDLNKDGMKLFNSFIEIAKQAGFKNISDQYIKNTDYLLKKNTDCLDSEEIELLNSFIPIIN